MEKIKTIKKPVEPIKPYAPYKPIKPKNFINTKEVISTLNDLEISVKEIINKFPKNFSLDKMFIEAYSDSFINCVYYKKVKNLSFEEQMIYYNDSLKIYKKEYKVYLNKLKIWKEKHKEYEKKLAEWKKENNKKQIKELENKLNVLKDNLKEHTK